MTVIKECFTSMHNSYYNILYQAKKSVLKLNRIFYYKKANSYSPFKLFYKMFYKLTHYNYGCLVFTCFI